MAFNISKTETVVMQHRSILIAASIYPPDPGGPALHAKKQYEYFQSQGYSVDLVALAHYRKYPKGIRHVFFLCVLFIKAFRVDVVYTHDALGVGFPATLVSVLLQKKLIIRVGGDLLWEREAEEGNTKLSMNEWYEAKLYTKKYLYSVIRWVFRNVDMIIVTSPLLLTIYKTYYEVPEERITVVANPVPAVSDTSPVSESHTIVYASRLVAYKNLSFVFESIAKILHQFPHIQLLILGDGPERKNLEKLSEDLGVSTQIIMKGSVSQDEVVSATRACMCTIAPALTEFNPNYVLQGIAMKKPFLISSENGFPFSVPNHLVFHARNHEEFEQRLSWILSDVGYREARALVESIHFTQTWEENLVKNHEILERVIAS